MQRAISYVRMSTETYDAQMARIASALSLLRRRSISNVHQSARDLTRKRYPHGIFISIRSLLDNAFLCVLACLPICQFVSWSVCLSVISLYFVHMNYYKL